MKRKPFCLLVASLLVAAALPLSASVRMSSNLNTTENRATYVTSSGWALPAGDWTIGIWDNNIQGNGGALISGPIDLVYVSPGRNLEKEGRFLVGGQDAAGNLFGSGGKALQNAIDGTLPLGYPGRSTGKFSPRLHIIRRNAGKSEYLVAEAGHGPVLVCSETRAFGATATTNWSLACIDGWAELYDSDLEGFFFATASVSNKDIALMAAGHKPSSAASLSGNLKVYFPLETAMTAQTQDPLPLVNQGSDSAVVLRRVGTSTRFQDGPLLRGSVGENTAPGEVTEPTNVVALSSFEPFQIIRHLNGSANVQFTGFDYGTGSAKIEIRFLDVEHSTSTAWQTLVASSPGGGAAIQATIPVAKGYWQTIEVRRTNSAGGTGDSSRPNRTWSRWAVGEIIVAMGDSIQGQVQSTATANRVVPNGFTTKYLSDYPNTIPSDTNPLSKGMWNLLKGSGMGGGTQGENELANNLSAASQCCVGVMVNWAGATRLALWNGRLSSAPYDNAKSFWLANGGLNKPSVITWVGNKASCGVDDFYADLNAFRDKLNVDLGENTWRLILAPVPIMFDGTSIPGMQSLRNDCYRWVRDNADVGAYAGISVDHLTQTGSTPPDYVHPTPDAWNIMGPRWGNAAGYLRDQVNYADPRAGEIKKFSRDGNTLLVEVQLYAGTALSLKNPAAKISGLSLSADNFTSLIPIASTTMVNATTFRITPPAGTTLPAGTLKLRYLYGRPGTATNATTLAQMGTDNILYVNAGPTNTLAVQPIYGTDGALAIDGASTPSPEVTVTGNAVGIADGDTTPSIADKTDFGSVNVASGSVTTTYTIQNQGTAALTINSVTLGGTHAADFAIITQPAASVAAGGSTTFSVRFDPSVAGTRTATVSFGNNDADENPYNFSVQGTGAAATQEVILDNTSPTGVTILPAGGWPASTTVAGYYGTNYIHDGNTGGGKSVRFTPTLPATGNYEVFAWWTSGGTSGGRATNVPIDIITSGAPEYVSLNQTLPGSPWQSLGVYHFNAGTSGSVLISNTGADGSVIVDAIKFTLIAPPLVNPSFETDASGSQTINGWTESGAVTASSVSSSVSAQNGSKYLGVWEGTPSSFTSQTMSSLPNGLYTLKAWTQRSTAGYVAQMEATPGGGATQAIAIPVGNTTWTQITLTNINVTNGSCTIGFRSTSPVSGAALRIDSVEFYKQ
ncbi:choice-of-anchor D domain-containing protein [Rariglobus hedericola]